jgi:hypothetical protein
MKTTQFSFSVLIVGCAMFAACGDNTSGVSTPIDSVNQAGKSDVQYTEGTPTTTIDTTIQARDQYSRDTLGNRAGQTQPSGNGTNSSNTSDARTTSGSSNNGDADKDRKK